MVRNLLGNVITAIFKKSGNREESEIPNRESRNRQKVYIPKFKAIGSKLRAGTPNLKKNTGLKIRTFAKKVVGRGEQMAEALRVSRTALNQQFNLPDTFIGNEGPDLKNLIKGCLKENFDTISAMGEGFSLWDVNRVTGYELYEYAMKHKNGIASPFRNYT